MNKQQGSDLYPHVLCCHERCIFPHKRTHTRLPLTINPNPKPAYLLKLLFFYAKSATDKSNEGVGFGVRFIASFKIFYVTAPSLLFI